MPNAAHLHAPPNQVYSLGNCVLTWLSRSCASAVSRSCAPTPRSPGHVPLGSVLRDSNLQELCTSTLLYLSHRPIGLQFIPHPQLLGHVFPHAYLCVTFHVASRSHGPPLLPGHVPSTLLWGSRASLALGHMPSPLTPRYTHMQVCARARFPRLQSHKLAWPPISGSHASSPATPIKCFRAQGHVPLHTPSLADRLHMNVTQLWSKASPLLVPAYW